MKKKIFRTILKTIGIIVGVLVFYVICCLLLPYIEVSAEKTTEPKTVELYILTNGVHTDLVVPVKSSQIDWSIEVPFENTTSKKADYKYLALGWGDKGFYLDTPTWADLKFSTAFNAAFWMSESAMHCTYYYKITEAEDCKKIMITEKEYGELIQFIKNQFDRDSSGKTMVIKTDAVYGNNDAFYDAKGSYSFLQTCNTWANDGLKAAKQKAAFWTATDKGIFMHYD